MVMSPLSPNRRHGMYCFYKYVTADAAKAILSSCTLKWSSPQLFNDPFDVPRRAKLPFTVDELQEAMREELIAVLEGRVQTVHPVLRHLYGALRNVADAHQRELLLDEVRTSLRNMTPTSTKALEMFGDMWRQMVPTLRILCLSEVNDSPMMWAHYAENNKGAVLRFDVIDDLDTNLLLAHSVTYSPHDPTLPGKEVWARSLVRHEPMPWQEYFRDYYYVKRMEWQHEREWRVISYAPDGESALFHYDGFHPRELSAVYLGANTSPDDEAAIAARLSGRFAHVSLYRSRFDHDRRQLTFVNRSSHAPRKHV